MTVRSAPSAEWKHIGEEFFISFGAILAMLASRLPRSVSSQLEGAPFQSLRMPSSSASTQEPISPTTGATISTFESISRGSMSIWMKRFEPGSPQVLPLPWESSQFRRAPTSSTTSESLSAVERAAPAESGWVSGRRPLAMLIGTEGMPLSSPSARTASSAWA